MIAPYPKVTEELLPLEDRPRQRPHSRAQTANAFASASVCGGPTTSCGTCRHPAFWPLPRLEVLPCVRLRRRAFRHSPTASVLVADEDEGGPVVRVRVRRL